MQNELKPAKGGTGKSVECDVTVVSLPFVRAFPISCMYYEPSTKTILVGRGNSTVEIWSYPHWTLVTRLCLQRGVGLKKVWGTGRYVVIVTTNGYLGVWDLQEGTQKQWLMHGGEWANDADFQAMGEEQVEALQKPTEDDTESLGSMSRRASFHIKSELEDGLGRVVIACNDGAWRLYKLEEHGLLSLVYTSTGRTEQATSCCFGSKSFLSGEDTVCVAYSTGNIRVFKRKNGNQLALVSGAGADSKEQKHSVWALKTLGTHFLVSGSSNGWLRVHEAKFGTMVQEFKEHEADILTLEVSSDHSKVFASGADSRITILGMSDNEETGITFQISDRERGQSHDIYCLLELHSDLLLSAGLSSDICLYKIDGSRFADRNRAGGAKTKLRHITSHVAYPPISYCSKLGLLTVNHNQWVDLFEVKPNSADIEYIAKISVDEHTTKTAAVSSTAGYICICTEGRMEIISYNSKKKQLARIRTDITEEPPKSAAFCGSKLFFVKESEPGVLFKLDLASNKVQEHKIKGLSKIKTFDIFKISSDGARFLAVDRYNRKALCCSIATGDSLDLSSFRKARVADASLCELTQSVYIVYETNIVLKINAQGKVVYFSSSKVPDSLRSLHDRFTRLLPHPGSKHKLLLVSGYSFIRLNTSHKYLEIARTQEREVLKEPDEAREDNLNQDSLRLVKTAKPIAGACLDSHGLLLLEFDWKTAMSEIPHPVITKKFGQ